MGRMRLLLLPLLALTACGSVMEASPACDLQAVPGDMTFFEDASCTKDVVVVDAVGAPPVAGDVVCQATTGARWTVSEALDGAELQALSSAPQEWWFLSASGSCVSMSTTLNLIMRDGEEVVVATPIKGQ